MSRLPPLLLLTGCFDDLELTDAPPAIDHVSLSCDGGDFTLVALASDANEVSDLWVAATADDGSTAEWTLDKDLDFATAGSSQWLSVDATGDCAASWSMTLTATNQLGISTTAEAAWPEVELAPRAVDPPYGSDAGGSTVRIEGESLDQVQTVWFGAAEASIQEVDADGLTVATPAGTPGPVDVTLRAGDAETVLAQAFTYYADATGLVRGELLPTVHVFDTAYFTITSAYASTSGPFAQFEAVFEAEALSFEQTYVSAWPAGGDCDWGADYIADWVDVGTYVLIDSDTTGEWPAQHGDNNVYYLASDGLDLSDWLGQSFALEIVDGTDDLPPMVAAEAMALPAAPVDASFDTAADNPFTWGEDFSLSWDPATGYDGLSYTLYPSQGSTVLGSTTCSGATPETGLSVPWATLTADIDADQVDTVFASITVWVDHETVLPHDNSVLWNRGRIVYWLYFTAQ